MWIELGGLQVKTKQVCVNEFILRSQHVVLQPTAPNRHIPDCLQSLSVYKCTHYAIVYFTYNYKTKTNIRSRVQKFPA